VKFYGDTTYETTADGFAGAPIGLPSIRVSPSSSGYGYTPVAKPVIRNNTINIDQGCASGVLVDRPPAGTAIYAVFLPATCTTIATTGAWTGGGAALARRRLFSV